MVFLIQNSQNRDGAAIQVKLDELIRTGAGKNIFVGIEHLSDDELKQLRRRRDRLDQAQQGLRRVHGGEEARREQKGRQEVQGCATGEVTGKGR